MNTRKLKSLTMVALTILLLVPVLSFSQPPMMDVDEDQQAALRQRVEMMRIWKLTELLNLDQDRAIVFFPRYQRHLAEMDSVDRQIREIHMSIEQGLHGENVNYAELVDRSFELENRRLELNHKLVLESADLLNKQEQAALLLFETRYHQRLREMMMELQREEGAPGRFRGGRPDDAGPGMHQRGQTDTDKGSETGRPRRGR
jgi:hypothetical protein